MITNSFLIIIILIIITIHIAEISTIINGITAQNGQIPWHASLIIKGSNGKLKICSGTIISHLLIITAAHCLKNHPRSISVSIGTTELKITQQKYLTTKFFQHPKFQSKWYDGKRADIGIIRLSKSIKFSNSIKPALLPFQLNSSFYLKKFGITSGYGVIDYDHMIYAQHLKWTPMYIFGEKICQKFHKSVNESDFICGFGWDLLALQNTSVCIGDSGTGLISKTNTTNYLIGILAMVGTNCTKLPAFFIEITQYLDWINEILNENL